MSHKVVLVLVALLFSGMVWAGGDAEAGKAKAMVCAACHGVDGNSVSPIWPKLAGQNSAYLASQLLAFRDGERQDLSMAPMVAGLSDQDIADLASYFAAQSVTTGGGDIADEVLGRSLYRAGDVEQKIPACMSCHGPAGDGNGPAGWPALAGQHPAYVVKQLQGYQSGARDAGQGDMMKIVASRLSEDEMNAVARYINLLQRTLVESHTP